MMYVGILTRFSLLLEEDSEKVLIPLLERMPPLDIDTARMLRKENELQDETSDSETTQSDSEEAIDDASSGSATVDDLLGLLDESRSRREINSRTSKD